MPRLLLAAGFVGSAVADALSGFALVQLKAERATDSKGAGRQGDLPDLARLFPSSAFSAMKTKIDALGHHLADAQRRDQAKIAKQKEEFEARLTEQRQQNRELERTNSEIALRTQHEKESNVALRRRAHDLAQENRELKSGLMTLQSNLTLAEEFVQQGLAAVEEKAPELQVLAELDELDAAASKKLEKQARLNEIASSPMGLSLLDFSDQDHERASLHMPAKDSPEVLIRHVMDQFNELSEKQNASEVSLLKAFEQKMRVETRKHADLLEEQARLNRSSATESALHDRLSVAAKHLSNERDNLLLRIKAIKNFAFRLGSSGTLAQDELVTPRADKTSAERHFQQGHIGGVAKTAAPARGVHVVQRGGGGRSKGQANASAAVSIMR